MQQSKTLTTLLLGFFFLLALSTAVNAQNNDERRRAFQLYEDAKYIEALPLFEKLAVANPNDREVIKTFGLLVLSQTAYLKDPAARKQARVRGRELLLKAQQLGSDDRLVTSMLAAVPPDGGDDTTFSTKKEVDEAIREGEGAFASGDFTKALQMYQRALLLDPTSYEAALFAGDVFFKQADQRKAGEWFARAAAINPDRETAYRYWGDALMKQGRVTEAGDKFVEAYIAEPYSRFAQAGFVNWGERVNVVLAHPKVELPANVTHKAEGGATIGLDPNMLKKDDKSGSTAAWMVYGIIRAGWQSEFAKQYPNEKKYRHSLKEEAAALRGALKALENQKTGDANNIDPSLQVLRKLEKEGLLEAYILLALPDEGIAKDFAGYRRTNIENLRRYVNQYVLKAGGQ